MAELTREDVKEVIREVTPGIVKEVVREVTPGIVREVVQEVTPGIVKAAIVEVVPPMIDAQVRPIFNEFEDRIALSTAKGFNEVNAKIDQINRKLVEHDDMVTPAQHRSLIKRVEALEDQNQ